MTSCVCERRWRRVCLVTHEGVSGRGGKNLCFGVHASSNCMIKMLSSRNHPRNEDHCCVTEREFCGLNKAHGCKQTST